MLKELTSNTSTPRGGGTDTPSEGSEHHESIVHEIEEVLRRELIEASSMADRPVSPNHYAQQRTMVVMETVKAATLATAFKLEKLAAEQRKKEEDLSSQSLIGPLPDDISKLRHQHSSYFSPQKLQIVKPMEGSVTLLRWKLLATPQLRDPSSLIENDRPGVHLKNYSVLSSEPNPSLLKVNSLANERKWHSVCDLPSQTTSRSATSNIPQKIINRPTEKQNAIQPQLSTVGKIKQNIWGLLSPSTGLKDKPSSESSGLGELLGP